MMNGQMIVMDLDYEIAATNSEDAKRQLKSALGDGTLEYTYTYRDESGKLVTAKDKISTSGIELKQIELGDKKWHEKLWGLVTNFKGTIQEEAEKILTLLLIPAGDGILSTMCSSVGEIVTIDRIIFNCVPKISIDYFNRQTDGEVRGSVPVKAMMKNVVNTWYNFFRYIAIVVYMMVLVFSGIKIIFSSTADKKAQYKEALTNWILGVAILFLFPYVMKYIIELNNSILIALQNNMTGGLQSSVYVAESEETDFFKVSAWERFKSWGDDKFVELMLGKSIRENVGGRDYIKTDVIKSDGMMYVRIYAAKLQKVFLVAVYFIQIGQTLVLLFMYYKRAFMIAFLITIFPLVAMTYALDKVGDKKAQSFGIWFKEFVVNVVVQIFHAIVYMVITSISVQSYIDSGGGNWLFMILSVLFLFQGEKILRNIFGIKSSAGTIGDLAATGAMIYGAAKGFGGMFGSKGGIGTDQDREDAAGVAERNAQRAAAAGSNNLATNASAAPSGATAISAPTGYGSGSENSSATSSTSATTATGSNTTSSGGTGSSGSSSTDNQRNGTFDLRGAMDKTFSAAAVHKTTRGLASGSVNAAARGIGGLVAATYGMSKGESNGSSVLGNAFTSAAAGVAVGDFVGKPIETAVNKIEQKRNADKVADNIASGNLDAELGLDQMMPANIDPDEIVGRNGETMQEIYRRALAEMAKVSGTKGMAKGEEAFFKIVNDLTDESKLQ